MFYECITGLVEIRAMGMEKFMEEKYQKKDDNSGKFYKFQDYIEYRNSLLATLKLIILVKIPFYIVYMYTGNLVLTLKLSITMMYIDRVSGEIFSIFNLKNQYDKNIESMDKFKEVIKLPVEEGYFSFDEDL